MRKTDSEKEGYAHKFEVIIILYPNAKSKIIKFYSFLSVSIKDSRHDPKLIIITQRESAQPHLPRACMMFAL